MRDYIIGFIIGVAACLLLLWLLFAGRRVPHPVDTTAEVQLDTIYIERAARPINLAGNGKITRHSAPKAPAAQQIKPATAPAPNSRPAEITSNVKLGLITDSLPAVARDSFTARLNTIFCSDTISISYDYPQNYFMLSLRPKPDSIMFRQIVIQKTSERWWIKPTIAAGSLILGVLIGRSIK